MIFYIVACFSSTLLICFPKSKNWDSAFNKKNVSTSRIVKQSTRPLMVWMYRFFVNDDQQLVPVQEGPKHGTEQLRAKIVRWSTGEEQKQGLTVLKCQTTSAELLSITNGLAKFNSKQGIMGRSGYVPVKTLKHRR